MSKEANIVFPIHSYMGIDIASEAVSIPAGAIASVVDFYFAQKPIADSNKAYIGGVGNTSIALTSTAFSTEVAKKKDSELANGEFWVDYITGKCRGKKASTATTGTVNYSIFQ